MKTSDMIDALVSGVTPVRRLRPPLVRAMFWLTLATAVIAAVALVHGLRPDLAQRLRQPEFWIGTGAALLTGAFAALAAFITSLPDRSRLWLLLPLPAAGVWISTIGYGCLAHWVALDPNGIGTGEVLSCIATLVLVSLPLSIIMFWMVRHVAKLRPKGPILSAGIAVAALTAAALSLIHRFDASIMILMWNFGTAALIIAIDAVIGRKIISGLGAESLPSRGT